MLWCVMGTEPFLEGGGTGAEEFTGAEGSCISFHIASSSSSLSSARNCAISMSSRSSMTAVFVVSVRNQATVESKARESKIHQIRITPPQVDKLTFTL